MFRTRRQVQTSNRPGRKLPGAVFGLVIGAGLIILLIIAGGQRELVDALITADRTLIALGFMLSLFSLWFRFLRWQCCLSRVNCFVPRTTSLIIFGAGLAMITTPGRVGELIRCTYLRSATGLPTSSTIPILVVERVTDAIAIFVVAIVAVIVVIIRSPSVPLHPLVIPAVVTTTGLTMLALIALRQSLVEHFTLWLCDRIRILQRFRSTMENFWQSTNVLLGRNVVLPSVVLGILAWACQCLTLYIAVLAIGRMITLWRAILVLTVSSVLGSITFLPAGLGAIDGSLIFLLVHAGLSTGRSVATTLVFRTLTLWLLLAVGAVAMLLSGGKRLLRPPGPS